MTRAILALFVLASVAWAEEPTTIEETYETVAAVSDGRFEKVFFIRADGQVQAARDPHGMTWRIEGDSFVVEWTRWESGIAANKCVWLHRVIRFRRLVVVRIEAWPKHKGGANAWLNMNKNMRDLKFP